MESGFSARLARVKVKTLSGSGQVTARVTRLRHFPYPGAIGLAGLGRVKLG
jgi:hypothetical protein